MALTRVRARTLAAACLLILLRWRAPGVAAAAAGANATAGPCARPAEFWSRHVDAWPAGADPAAPLCGATWLHALRAAPADRAPPAECAPLAREWVAARVNELAGAPAPLPAPVLRADDAALLLLDRCCAAQDALADAERAAMHAALLALRDFSAGAAPGWPRCADAAPPGAPAPPPWTAYDAFLYGPEPGGTALTAAGAAFVAASAALSLAVVVLTPSLDRCLRRRRRVA